MNRHGTRFSGVKSVFSGSEDSSFENNAAKSTASACAGIPLSEAENAQATFESVPVKSSASFRAVSPKNPGVQKMFENEPIRCGKVFQSAKRVSHCFDGVALVSGSIFLKKKGLASVPEKSKAHVCSDIAGLKGAQTVFESIPEKSTAQARCDEQLKSSVMPTTFENSPQKSTAQARHNELIKRLTVQSTFESIPEESKAQARCDEQFKSSVMPTSFENSPQKSTAQARHNELIKRRNVRSTFESIPEESKAQARCDEQLKSSVMPTTFENSPQKSTAQARHNELIKRPSVQSTFESIPEESIEQLVSQTTSRPEKTFPTIERDGRICEGPSAKISTVSYLADHSEATACRTTDPVKEDDRYSVRSFEVSTPFRASRHTHRHSTSSTSSENSAFARKRSTFPRHPATSLSSGLEVLAPSETQDFEDWGRAPIFPSEHSGKPNTEEPCRYLACDTSSNVSAWNAEISASDFGQSTETQPRHELYAAELPDAIPSRLSRKKKKGTVSAPPPPPPLEKKVAPPPVNII